MIASLLKRLGTADGLTTVGVVLCVFLILLAFVLTASAHSALFLVLIVLAIICLIFL